MKNNLLHLLLATVSITGIVSTANTAFAATLKTVSYSAVFKPDGSDSGYSSPYADTYRLDYESPLSIQKFDPKLGKLKTITLDLFGKVIGDAKVENRSARATTANIQVSSLFTLFSPNNQSLMTMETKTTRTYNLPRYDGRTDFAGASGRTATGLTSEGFDTKTLVDNSFLSMFTGTGNLNFRLGAISTSTVNGTGNITSEINSFAGGNLKVTYNYAQVPEPATLVGLATTLGLAALSTRKKASKDS